MSKPIRVHAPSLAAHLQTCLLHNNEKMEMCSGSFKRKGACISKAIGPLELDMMPTCRKHRDQLKKSAWCRALLLCGFECGRICPWKAHENPLCSDHHKHPMPCYLLKIPLELRFRIYGHLLPDRPIPARYANSRCLTSDGGRVYTALLRVNHQIHDETVHLLYATRVFTIELAADGLVMCNSSKKVIHGGNHALQDYQMQLMLLEQQKRRIMMASQVQDNMINNGSSSSSYRPIIDYEEQPTGASVIPYTSGPIEPAWDPPFRRKYFDMICSFLIEIKFPPPSERNYSGYHIHDTPEGAKALESKLYDYCDHIHKLVGTFRLMQRPLGRLEIVLKLGQSGMKREVVISMAQVLLRPFQRLRNVGTPVLPFILVKDIEDREVELLNNANWASSTADRNFHDYLTCWSRDLSSSGPTISSSVFNAYWQLERLLSGIKSYNSSGKFYLFPELLHNARVAREADDIQSFKAAWERVVNIWLDYVNDERRFRSNVSLSMAAIWNTIKRDA